MYECENNNKKYYYDYVAAYAWEFESIINANSLENKRRVSEAMFYVIC